MDLTRSELQWTCNDYAHATSKPAPVFLPLPNFVLYTLPASGTAEYQLLKPSARLPLPGEVAEPLVVYHLWWLADLNKEGGGRQVGWGSGVLLGVPHSDISADTGRCC